MSTRMNKRRAGLTLLEVLIASVIMAALVAMSGWLVWSSSNHVSSAEVALQLDSQGREFLTNLAKELHQTKMDSVKKVDTTQPITVTPSTLNLPATPGTAVAPPLYDPPTMPTFDGIRFKLPGRTMDLTMNNKNADGNATQTVSQGYAYGPTPARQSVQAPAPPPLQAAVAGGRGGAAARPPQPYAGSYPESLVKDVIPFVEKTYRAIANKDNRAIAGLSMGGGHTLMATNNNPGVFGYIGVFSSGPRTVDEAYEQQLKAVKAGGVKFYWTGAGTTDMAREGTMNLHSLLEKHGFKTSYKEIPGSHYWFLWRDFLADFGTVLFREGK